MQSLLSRVPPNGGQAPASATVTGQRIAKASNYTPQQRADDAARWLRGELTVQPTVALAARTFRVSVPLVAAARERFAQRAARPKRFGNGGTAILSDSALESIIREVGVDRVWCAIDRLTSPELPLVAAE
jgi:hypothetical protein